MNGYDHRPEGVRSVSPNPQKRDLETSLENQARSGREHPSYPTVPAWKSVPPLATLNPLKTEQTKRLIITGTRKGGTGKSFFLAHLADWFEHHQVNYVALDPDWVNGSLSRFLPNARFIDFSSEQATQEILSAFQETDIVIMDGMGPAQAYLFDWLKNADFLNPDNPTPIAVTIALLIEEDKDCVYQAGEAAHSLDNQVEWLVIRNLKTCSTTEIYDQSNARQELLRRDAQEIQIERLPWNLLLLMQRTSRTIGDLIEDADLTILERQRLRSYQTRFFGQLESVRASLMPRSIRRAPTKRFTQDPSRVARPRIAPEQV